MLHWLRDNASTERQQFTCKTELNDGQTERNDGQTERNNGQTPGLYGDVFGMTRPGFESSRSTSMAGAQLSALLFRTLAISQIIEIMRKRPDLKGSVCIGRNWT